MLPSHNCFSILQKTRPLFSNIYKVGRHKTGPVRCFFKRKRTDEPKVQRKEVMEPLTGIDDPKFSDFFFEYIFNREAQKQTFAAFITECKKFKKELKDNHVFNTLQVKSTTPKLKILFKFEKPEDLDGFHVVTDSVFNAGYSSASFKLSENETGIFSGNICLDAPKTGTGNKSGYANLSFPKQIMSFFRVQPFDFSEYTHLVLKIRGDGRVYMILLHTPQKYKEIMHTLYCHQIFTRGGPYWQIAKIPLHHFYLSVNGYVNDLHSPRIPLTEKLSITVAAYEGPFKLEIDYIGLEFQKFEKQISPYERYRKK